MFSRRHRMDDGTMSGGGGAFDDFLARYLAGERARQQRAIDLGRFMTARTQELLQQAAQFALSRGQREVDTLHVLRVLMDAAPAQETVRRIGADPTGIAREAESRLPSAAGSAGADGTVVTPALQRALFHSFQVARSSGSTYIDPEHLFFALVLAQDTPAGQVLAQAGVTADALTQSTPATVSAGTDPAEA